jgi:mannose-6-phosphate isomerase
MPVERVTVNSVNKPWGVADPRPWAQPSSTGARIGELWYERTDRACTLPSLLIKLLFTSQPLSIQVHPDDAFARSIGLPNGKSEAWYIVDAAPDAKVALGLSRTCTPQQLRQSIEDGSIAELVVWRPVVVGDVISVPAGTIHAIGGGLIIAEIQQRSDTTYRLFDHGRQRDLHVDCAVAAAHAGAATIQSDPVRISHQRTLLASNPYFLLERVELTSESAWRLQTSQETWLLALSGSASVGPLELSAGEAIFADAGQIELRVGVAPLNCLVAYIGDVRPNLLLQCLARGQSDGAIASERTAQVVHGSFNQRLPRQRGSKEETYETAPAYCVRRQSLATPLRNRHLHA